jgi:hypothetical protein
VNRSPLIFYDTANYLRTGQSIITRAAERLAELSAPEPETGGAAAAAGAKPTGGAFPTRSVYYSVFAYPSAVALPATGFLTIWLQSLLVTAMIALLLDRRLLGMPGALAGAALGLAALTALPFYVSWLMPDILGAVVVLWALLLVRGVERLSIAEWLFVLGAATFALTSHYGFLGLAVGLGGCAVLLLALRQRLSFGAAVLAAAPILLAMAANLAASMLVYNEPSLTPKRFPILLARSLVDGPARWYLKDACPAAGYELCRDIDTLPDTLGSVLWDEDGLMKSRTPDQLDRIRREEIPILLAAFKAYPLQQGWSLARNSVTQLGSIGLADHVWAPLQRDAHGVWERFPEDADRTGLDGIGTIHTLVVFGAAAYVALLLFGRKLDPGRREPDLVLMLALALLMNAVVFGGLSAPADRYQGKIAWLVPMLAAMLWLGRRPARVGRIPS